MNDADGIEGVIGAWSSADSIGRIELATGESIRFGGTACAFVPAVGLRVVVRALEAHPLGGRRARSVTLEDPRDADRVLDDAAPLRGTLATDEANAEFADEVNARGLLGILLREPVTSRADLRARFARADVAVRFDDPRAPMIRAGDVAYHVLLCTRELPGGRGFLSFAPASPFSLDRERELALASAETGGPRVERLPALAPLVEVVARCARTEAAVCAHQAIGSFVAPAEWEARSPLARWTNVVRHQDGQLLLSGLRSLCLPDLWGPPTIDRTIDDAASALVDLGRRPDVGERLGDCRVAASGYDWVQLEPR